MKPRILTLLAVILTLTTGAVAQPTTAPGAKPAATQERSTDGPPKSDDTIGGRAPVVTHHSIKIADKELAYTATAGWLPMKDETGKLHANVFFVAYTKDGAKGDPDHPPDHPPDHARPITFVFNGGPGAAAVWLHLGTAGPMRLDLAEDGQPGPPPHKLVENSSTWLTTTDLVFIDPVGTGYSRAATPEQAKEFYGVREDISSIADFIRLYLTRYDRWGSPKFLAGESYGTLRAAALSEYLNDHDGIILSGIILVSSVLDFQTFQFEEGNDLPYVNFLPSYAAVAWYHKKLPPELQGDLTKTLDEATRFATGDYAAALAKGAALGDDDRKRIAEQLARYTGLSRAEIDHLDLRVPQPLFSKKLLEDQRKIIGRFDGRITGLAVEPTSSEAEYDPSLSRYLGVYTSTFLRYVREDLHFESDLKYEVLSSRNWDFGPGGHGYLTVTDNLRAAMAKNPDLRVMIASGYFDLAAPYYATTYTINHLGLPREALGRVSQKLYLGGHMMYHVKPALDGLERDVAAFIEGNNAKPQAVN